MSGKEPMQIKGGIHLKLLSTMIGLIFGLLAILTTVQITYQKRVLEKTLDRRLALMKDILIERGKTLADNLARQAENDIAGFNFSGINESVSKAVEKDPELAYGILMDSSRTAFVHTLHPQQVQETLNGEQDLFAARQAEPVHHEYRENGGDYIEFISPIRTGIQNWGFLRLGYSLHLLNQELVKSRSEIAGQIKAMVFRSIVTSLVFVALGSLVVLWVSARLTRPLLRLSETADALAKGDFSAAEHMEIQSRDEVGVLAKAFTEMSKQLKISYGKLEDYSRTLEQKVEERTRELAAMTERAEAANRTKSQFLSAMSHELRTPLNAIIGYSEMLEEDCEDLGHNDYVPDLRKIHSAGKHLLGLINDILDLSKIEAGRMDLHYEVFDLANTVKSVAGMTQPLSEKNQNIFELKTAKDIGAMNADETRVRQILFNLVSNACKFTEKGTITLDVERRRTEHGDWIHFTVSDTGIGMSPEQMKKLFQSFSQVHTPNQKYGGTGLGLAITRRLCQMMGGSIDVDSSPGRGTTFVVRLPAEPPAEEKAEEAVAKRSLPAEEGKEESADSRRPGVGDRGMILAIDDDPRVLELLARNLRKDGYTVVGAAGGNEGIRLARELHPFAITLDIRMPDRDGWSVLCELKADPALASIPVIVITVEENEKLGYVLGASDYLVKPISFKSLREILVKHQQAGRSCLVLVVDDDKGTRALLSESIRKAGWRVREAENGRVALDLLAEEKTDLILLDLMMPVMDGFEFLEELRSRKSSQFPPVVVVTAKDLTPQDVQRLEGNVLQVLHKGSYSLDDLVGEIRKRIVSCTQADKPGKE